MDKENYVRLTDFIGKMIGFRITEKTIFFKDLKLIGDDADEFIERFSKEFKIDMTGFEFNQYFVEEYKLPFAYWIDFLFRKEKLKRKEIGLNHLLEIIEKKRWIDIA